MKRLICGVLAFAAAAVVIASPEAWSQSPDGGRGKKGGKEKGRPPRFELGKVLPPFARDELNLTDEQQKQLAALEKEVKAKLVKVDAKASVLTVNADGATKKYDVNEKTKFIGPKGALEYQIAPLPQLRQTTVNTDPAIRASIEGGANGSLECRRWTHRRSRQRWSRAGRSPRPAVWPSTTSSC